MNQRIFAIAIAAMLVGCSAPTPPAPLIAPPEPVLTEPEAEPEAAPAVEEPAPPPEEPKPHVDDPALVASIRSLIAERDAMGSKVYQAGVAIDGSSHAGTFYNEVHIPEHRCSVLGQLLGMAELVRPIEVSYEPDFDLLTDVNAQDLRVMGISLGNYAHVATRILDMPHDERVVTWNLDCSGQLGLPTAHLEQHGQSSFYTVANDGKVLTVLGTIEKGFAQKIKDAIESNPGVVVVSLGSGGGFVYEAMEAGAFIRSRGLDTILHANCYSSCPLVFMAGVARQNWSPYPSLGFHQIYTEGGEAVPLDSEAYRDIGRYLFRMDIDARIVLSLMWSAPPQGMTTVDGFDETLCRARITTWIQRGCSMRQ